VNEDAVRGEALGTVARDSVAMVEMTMISGVKLDLAVVVEARGKLPSGAIDSRQDRDWQCLADLSGAVKLDASPTENWRSISR